MPIHNFPVIIACDFLDMLQKPLCIALIIRIHFPIHEADGIHDHMDMQIGSNQSMPVIPVTSMDTIDDLIAIPIISGNPIGKKQCVQLPLTSHSPFSVTYYHSATIGSII